MSSGLSIEGPVTGLTYRWGGGSALTVNIYDSKGAEVDVFTMGGSGDETEAQIEAAFRESVARQERCAAGEHEVAPARHGRGPLPGLGIGPPGRLAGGPREAFLPWARRPVQPSRQYA